MPLKNAKLWRHKFFHKKCVKLNHSKNAYTTFGCKVVRICLGISWEQVIVIYQAEKEKKNCKASNTSALFKNSNKDYNFWTRAAISKS